LPGGTEG